MYLSFSPQKLANLDLSLDDRGGRRAERRGSSGVINTPHENMLVDVTGSLVSPEDIADLNLWIDGHFYKLTDIASVERGYSDPQMFRVNGKPAIGIGVNMRDGGNNLTFGEGLRHAAESLVERLPIGIELNLVSDQPEVVREAIGEFTKALVEAVAIVLAVSFVSLGLRADRRRPVDPARPRHRLRGDGAMGISLQRISLGALIIALGLLVDDGDDGDDDLQDRGRHGQDEGRDLRLYLHGLPDADGHLVTVFGFLPIGFADNNTGQYTSLCPPSSPWRSLPRGSWRFFSRR